MILRKIFCALSLLICAVVAQAHDMTTERSWVEDPTGSMSLAEARQAPATPFDGKIFTQGFSRSAYWIRLHINPSLSTAQSADERLVIRIRPPFQDQVWLYDPLARNDQVRTTGDYFDWEQDEYQSLNLNFIVPLGKEPRDVWLRLVTNQSTMTSVEVMTMEEVRSVDHRQELFSLLYLSALLVCLSWAILTWVNQRDGLLAKYIVRGAFTILYALTTLGYCRFFFAQWLAPPWLDILTNLIFVSFVAVVIWFDAHLLAEFKPNRWLLGALRSLLLLLPVELVLVLAGYTYYAIYINSIAIFIGLLLALGCALTGRAWASCDAEAGREQPVLAQAFLVGAYSLAIAATMLSRLPVMGLIPAQNNFFYFYLVYPVVTSVTLMILVQMRLYRIARRQRDAQHRLQLAEFEAEKERLHRIEQSNFLKMLAHEMKTSLSIVHLGLAGEQMSAPMREKSVRAVVDMNSVIDRLLQVERLNDQKHAVQRSRFKLFESIVALIDLTRDPDRWLIDCDPSLVIQSDQGFVRIILSNLIDNADKYGAPDQPLQLRVRESGEGGISITVENHIGPAGAPDPDQVFYKYYRAPGAHERTGSGLGAYLTKCLVEILGGRITMTLRDGRIAFEVWLPAVDS